MQDTTTTENVRFVFEKVKDKTERKQIELRHITKFLLSIWVVFTKYIRIKDLLIFAALFAVSHFAYLFLTWLYPTTGEPSFQWLYFLLFGLTRGVAIIGVGYLVLSIFIPKGFRYLEGKNYESDLKNLTEWQRILYFFFLYAFFIVVMLISVVTM